MAEVDILDVNRGSITAPAGCGKTQLIADALTRNVASKPILVLTHTNAGVVALRSRLTRLSVPRTSFRLSTIDGWAMRLIGMFPKRSGDTEKLLQLSSPANDYPAIRDAAAALLQSGHIDDIIPASYSRLIVDEYQDCSVRQHKMLTRVAGALPTCVLGDPMQAIFGFGLDGLASWDSVCKSLPVAGQLETPWRWINANAAGLGQWLLQVRELLLRGDNIDLRTAPSEVQWVELDGRDDHKKRTAAALVKAPSTNGRVLIIGDAMNPMSRHSFASKTPGTISVEAVDLRDMVSFARTFDIVAPDALTSLLKFAATNMTNVGAAETGRRIRSLIIGSARNPPSEVERNAISFVNSPTHRHAAEVLTAISRKSKVRVFRPVPLNACIKALNACEETDGLTFEDAAIRMREQNRMLGRSLPRRAVGSTLLLKGLESEVAVVLNAGELNARNLYVAMTRGSQHLTLCSPNSVLRPHAN
ncbi:MAG: UvrD-helicase domain-containing protein [Planctomycetales bacterium]